jgi:membrane-associated protease RseP (regulator of RpoE activity)
MVRELRRRSIAALLGAVGAFAIVLFMIGLPVSAEPQGETPYDKERLLKVVRLNALSTKEIVQAIQRRGVSFQMTPAVEAEFRAVNTPPSVLDALRANYRAPSAPVRPTATETPARPVNRAPANATGGPPLGKNEIVTLLQNGVSASRVEQLVEGRGVNFSLNPEITREIMSAGGTRSLVGAISEKSTSSSSNPPANSDSAYSGIGASMEDRAIGGQSYIFITGTAPNSPAARAGLMRGDRLVEIDGQSLIGRSAENIVSMVRGPSGSTVNLTVERAATKRVETLRITREVTSIASLPTNSNSGPNYDDLTDQATAAIAAALTASDISYANRGLNLLQQALRLDPSRPTAYQLLGYLQLYGFHNIVLAEQSMRAAIERGGSAVFFVAHDDGGVFSTSCTGSLFVSKTSVSYKASNSDHAFETEKSKIQEAKLNSIVGAHLAAFHLKVTLNDGGKDKSKTFNFAPATQSQAESNLVVNLIRSY